MEEKIIARIQKMLAIANDLKGATEHERDTALQMAYRLMAKHNLDMATIEAAGQKVEEPRVDFSAVCFNMLWCRDVADAIANLFFCRVYFYERINATQRTYHFIGRESNAMTAAVMTDYIIKSVLKEGRKMYGDNLSPKTRAFGTGCAQRLWERVQQLKRAEQAEATPGTAIVLASLYQTEFAANQVMIDAIPGMKTSKAVAKAVDGAAYHEGKAFGDKINLNKQIGGSASNKQIK